MREETRRSGAARRRSVNYEGRATSADGRTWVYSCAMPLGACVRTQQPCTPPARSRALVSQSDVLGSVLHVNELTMCPQSPPWYTESNSVSYSSLAHIPLELTVLVVP